MGMGHNRQSTLLSALLIELVKLSLGSHLSVATLRGRRQKGQQVGVGCERGENYCIAIAIEEYIVQKST